jgi:adenosylcobyric acid synthase
VLGRPAPGYTRELITDALLRLAADFDVVVIEGAGSPAEINLRDRDVANMDVAAILGAPVVLVADIDRGGVFAQIVGTMELLAPDERERVAGFLINKFRGDLRALEPGIREMESRYGRPVFGVLPWFDPQLPEEDTVREPPAGGPIAIDVVRLPRIANFDDFEPLAAEPDVTLRYIDRPGSAPPDLLILPGTKDTLGDLAWLRQRGLDAYAAACPAVVGICGGYQMMGSPGLGLLDCTTTFEPTKVTARVDGSHFESGLEVRGYEIHHGRTTGGDGVFLIHGRPEGTRRGRSWGSSIHGLFDNDEFRAHVLNDLRKRRELPERPATVRPNPFDRLAGIFRCHADVEAMLRSVT